MAPAGMPSRAAVHAPTAVLTEGRDPGRWVSLYFTHYNFARPHQSLGKNTAPVMAAGAATLRHARLQRLSRSGYTPHDSFSAACATWVTPTFSYE
jgi:hypothetical protein